MRTLTATMSLGWLILATLSGCQAQSTDSDHATPLQTDSLKSSSWCGVLSPDAYRVLREQGTEPRFSGEFWLHEEDGVYVLDGDTTNWVAAGCGVDNGFGGYNRRHVRSGLAEVLDVVCFNACSDCDDLTSQMSGCTDSIATNYDADAVVDDDSCVYNDDCSLACGPGTYWDASDQLCLPIISADLDLDGCVGSSDLLELLTQFGLCN